MKVTSKISAALDLVNFRFEHGTLVIRYHVLHALCCAVCKVMNIECYNQFTVPFIYSIVSRLLELFDDWLLVCRFAFLFLLFSFYFSFSTFTLFSMKHQYHTFMCSKLERSHTFNQFNIYLTEKKKQSEKKVMAIFYIDLLSPQYLYLFNSTFCTDSIRLMISINITYYNIFMDEYNLFIYCTPQT